MSGQTCAILVLLSCALLAANVAGNTDTCFNPIWSGELMINTELQNAGPTSSLATNFELPKSEVVSAPTNNACSLCWSALKLTALPGTANRQNGRMIPTIKEGILVIGSPTSTAAVGSTRTIFFIDFVTTSLSLNQLLPSYSNFELDANVTAGTDCTASCAGVSTVYVKLQQTAVDAFNAKRRAALAKYGLDNLWVCPDSRAQPPGKTCWNTHNNANYLFRSTYTFQAGWKAKVASVIGSSESACVSCLTTVGWTSTNIGGTSYYGGRSLTRIMSGTISTEITTFTAGDSLEARFYDMTLPADTAGMARLVAKNVYVQRQSLTVDTDVDCSAVCAAATTRDLVLDSSFISTVNADRENHLTSYGMGSWICPGDEVPTSANTCWLANMDSDLNIITGAPPTGLLVTRDIPVFVSSVSAVLSQPNGGACAQCLLRLNGTTINGYGHSGNGYWSLSYNAAIVKTSTQNIVSHGDTVSIWLFEYPPPTDMTLLDTIIGNGWPNVQLQMTVNQGVNCTAVCPASSNFIRVDDSVVTTMTTRRNAAHAQMGGMGASWICQRKSSSSSELSTGGIVGIAIGSASFAIILAAAAAVCIIRGRRRQAQMTSSSTSASDVALTTTTK